MAIIRATIISKAMVETIQITTITAVAAIAYKADGLRQVCAMHHRKLPIEIEIGRSVRKSGYCLFIFKKNQKLFESVN